MKDILSILVNRPLYTLEKQVFQVERLLHFTYTINKMQRLIGVYKVIQTTFSTSVSKYSYQNSNTRKEEYLNINYFIFVLYTI